MSSVQKYNFKNISASGTTVVQSGHGTLHTVVINTTAATGIVIYDGLNVGGTRIATIAASPVIGSTLMYDAEFTSGLTVVVGGNSDITLSIG